MVDPGHIYEKAVLEKWLKQNSKSPINEVMLSHVANTTAAATVTATTTLTASSWEMPTDPTNNGNVYPICGDINVIHEYSGTIIDDEDVYLLQFQSKKGGNAMMLRYS